MGDADGHEKSSEFIGKLRITPTMKRRVDAIAVVLNIPSASVVRLALREGLSVIEKRGVSAAFPETAGAKT